MYTAASQSEQHQNLPFNHNRAPLVTVAFPVLSLGSWVLGHLSIAAVLMTRITVTGLHCMALICGLGKLPALVANTIVAVLVGVSLSEPHTSVTSLRCACVCLFAACLDLANTVTFKSANFTCTCTIIFKFNNELNTPRCKESRIVIRYLFDGR